MSRVFREKSKDLINLEVVTHEKVWIKDKSGKWKLRNDIELYGKVQKGFSSAVVSMNRQDLNNKFLEDFSVLTKKTKNEITNKLLNENRRVVYLIKKRAETI